MRLVVFMVAVATLSACGSDAPAPARLETGSVACASCRMIVSDVHFAAQIVAPGEEPLFFDDLACLANHMRREPPASDAAVYVADHQTGQWILASRAVYTRARGLATPMGGGIVAHGDAASRARDPVTSDGDNVEASELFGDAVSGRNP